MTIIGAEEQTMDRNILWYQRVMTYYLNHPFNVFDRVCEDAQPLFEIRYMDIDYIR